MYAQAKKMCVPQESFHIYSFSAHDSIQDRLAEVKASNSQWDKLWDLHKMNLGRDPTETLL